MANRERAKGAAGRHRHTPADWQAREGVTALMVQSVGPWCTARGAQIVPGTWETVAPPRKAEDLHLREPAARGRRRARPIFRSAPHHPHPRPERSVPGAFSVVYFYSTDKGFIQV